MHASEVFEQIFRLQKAFQVIGTLMLTAYLFPKQAEIDDIMQEFDMIVVGGGSAGIVVATRLVECNFNVLLIEAGGNPPEESLFPGLLAYLYRTEYDWNYTNVRGENRFQCLQEQTLYLPSGRMLGGGSSINYMFYVRGCPDDFRYWADAVNDSSWNYDGILPYFIKSERLVDPEILRSRYRRYHGTRGVLGVSREQSTETLKYLESFRQLGHEIVLDINGDRNLGYTQQMYTIAEGIRQSTAYSFLGHYSNPNLKVLRNTLVTKILFDAYNCAIGVRATLKNNREVTIRARREVIISAGAIGTPKLLMLSGIGPREHLESHNIPVRLDLPVGKNLHDHTPVLMNFPTEGSSEPDPPINVHRYFFPTFSGYVALNKLQRCPTYQATSFVVHANSTLPYQLCFFNFGFNADICERLYSSGEYRNSMFTVMSLLHPESRGEVLLRSCDPRDPALVDVGYLRDGRDVEALADSAMDFVRVLNTSYFKSVNSQMTDFKLPMCEGLEYMSREWWRCYVRCLHFTIYHYVGTCAMGSVVDGKLQVLGASNLRVVDASVMPRVVGANTNAAVVAIAEKAADIIKKDYSCTGRRHRGNA